jgi:hypothetical protein
MLTRSIRCALRGKEPFKRTFSNVTENIASTTETNLLKQAGGEVGESVSTITKTSKDGSFIQKINIISKWSTMSRNKKIAVGAYASFVFATYVGYSYNDGKQALLQDRLDRLEKNKSSKSLADIRSHEWYVVRKGATHKKWENMWSSIFFPYTFIEAFIPNIIITMNPPEKKGNQSTDDIRTSTTNAYK